MIRGPAGCKHEWIVERAFLYGSVGMNDVCDAIHYMLQ